MGNDLRDWLIFSGTLLAWAFTLGTIWSKLNIKIDENAKEIDEKATRSDLNGLGGRVSALEADFQTRDGRMERTERELGEYRRDASDSASTTARVEKSVDDLRTEIQHNHLVAGSRLDEIKTILQDNDKNTTNRLVRLEAITAIEKKLGPIITD